MIDSALNDPTMPCAMCDGEGITPSKAFVSYRNVEERWKAEFDKKHPLQTCNLCNGEGTVYYMDGEQERFNMLGDRWEEDTMHLSSPEIDHPCFIAMNKMKSKEAIVWVLKRMRKEPAWLTIMLLGMWIKKSDSPTTEDMRGKFTEMTEAWIKWGIEKKLIKRKK